MKVFPLAAKGSIEEGADILDEVFTHWTESSEMTIVNTGYRYIRTYERMYVDIYT